MLGDRRLVGLASKAGVFVLLEPSSEASLGLSDVDFSCRPKVTEIKKLSLNNDEIQVS